MTLIGVVICAVIVGQWISPASPSVKDDGTEIHTLWGDIAYQLAGLEGYQLVETEDRSGSNPGSKLIDLSRAFCSDLAPLFNPFL